MYTHISSVNKSGSRRSHPYCVTFMTQGKSSNCVLGDPTVNLSHYVECEHINKNIAIDEE